MRSRAWRSGGKTLDTLIEQGLRARLELASLITGQLYVELNMFPGSPIREAPERTRTITQIPSVPSLQSGVQQTLSDLIANQPKLAKGLDQMLELLNFMTAGRRRAEARARGDGALDAWLDGWPTQKGPLLQTLDQLPALMPATRSDRRGRARLVEPADQTLASVDGLVGGAGRARGKSLADLQATLVATRSLTEQLAKIVDQVRTPVVGFAQGGLPQLQGLIQDSTGPSARSAARSATCGRTRPRFLLGDPAAQGVKLQ